MTEPVAPDDTGRKQDGTFAPGCSGNPNGRPKSARSRLSEAFLKALADDFEQHGALAIVAGRDKDPNAYLRTVAALQPKVIEGSDDPDSPPVKTSMTVKFE